MQLDAISNTQINLEYPKPPGGASQWHHPAPPADSRRGKPSGCPRSLQLCILLLLLLPSYLFFLHLSCSSSFSTSSSILLVFLLLLLLFLLLLLLTDFSSASSFFFHFLLLRGCVPAYMTLGKVEAGLGGWVMRGCFGCQWAERSSGKEKRKKKKTERKRWGGTRSTSAGCVPAYMTLAKAPFFSFWRKPM